MKDWHERIVQHVLNTPPTCLVGFHFADTQSVAGSWSCCLKRRLRCQCGSDSGEVLGYSLKDYSPDYRGPELFLGPLAFQCPTCKKITEIIDTNFHGYNAEIDKLDHVSHSSATIAGEGSRSHFRCPHCAGRMFIVAVDCVYSHFDLMEDEPELEPYSQDYFDWFTCNGICAMCKRETLIADFELA